MSRVLFTVSYSIESERLPEYEELIRRMKKINAERELDYSVFKDKNGQFTELTIYTSEEAFEEADDLMDDAPANEYISRINAMANNISYHTMYEMTGEE